MASEEQDILTKINQLRGQIDQHKSDQQGNPTSVNYVPRTRSYSNVNAFSNNQQASVGSYPPNPRHNRGGYAATRGSARGRGGAPIHRNRTLVLNGGTQVDPPPAIVEASGSSTPAGPGQAWVSKTDRHMQLINTSIYEKDSQARAKAIEETRQQKLKQREEREKTRFTKHLQRAGVNVVVPGRAAEHSGNYEVVVQGIKFRVLKNGGKLVKVSGDLNAAKSTPKTALIGGVKFHRSTNGNMYRAGIIKAHRRLAGVKKINEPCKIFSTTGSCPKGPRCRYVHDPSKVAVCKELLQKGSCPSGDSCDLSHELTPERTPSCLHFSKGNCSNPNCRYTHVRVSPAALVCRPFALYGFCEKGLTCQEKHVHECPDFSNTGTCNTKGCKLPHRYKASVMRNNTTNGEAVVAGDDSDVESDDDDEEIDSEDVDSDDLDEEMFGLDDGTPDPEISEQRDFIQLR